MKVFAVLYNRDTLLEWLFVQVYEQYEIIA